jgi:exosome complex component RRP40
MDAKTNVPVVPGDVIGRLTATQTTTIRLGQGLIQDGDTIIATKAGILRFRAPDKYYIEASQKRVRCASVAPMHQI